MKPVNHIKRRIKKELGLEVDLSKVEVIGLYWEKEKMVNASVDNQKLLPVTDYDESWHYWPKTGEQCAMAIRD